MRFRDKLPLVLAALLCVSASAFATASLSTYLDLGEIAAPSVSGAGTVRLYADATGHNVQVSANGGAFSPAVTAASLSSFGVSSITGTANQVNASGSIGAITLSLPQSIATSSAPTFAGATLSAQTNAALGTAGAPAYSFTGDLNTGLFSSGADTVDLSTGGTSRLTLTTTTLTSTLAITHPAGSTTTCAVNFASDPNTGVYSPGADQVALVTGGTARFTLSTSAMTTTLPARGQDGSVSAPAFSFSADTNVGLYRPTTDQLAATAGGVQAQLWTATGTQLSGVVSHGAVAATPLASSTISDDSTNGIVADIVSTIPDNRVLQYQYRPTGTGRSYTSAIGVGVVGTSFFHFAFSEAEASDAALAIHAGSTAVTVQTMSLSTVLPLTLSHYDNAGAGTTTDYLILDPADTSLTLGVNGGKMGFFGLATPISKPTVTGSRGGNAALADLLQELQNLGLITDSSS